MYVDRHCDKGLKILFVDHYRQYFIEEKKKKLEVLKGEYFVQVAYITSCRTGVHFNIKSPHNRH